MGKTLILVLIPALLIFAIIYFFSIAFVRRKEVGIDDLDSKENEFLAKYKSVIKSGMDFINSQPHQWFFVKSFDNLKLAARYYDNNSENTIILFHGYRSSANRDFSCAVKMYYEYGFNVLLVDQRSHGRSEGRLITFGVKESRDVISWISFVLENINQNMNVYLGGMSMGATTVMLAAGLNLPHNIKGIIADCGFTSPVSIIKKVAKDSFKINAELFMPLMNLLCRIFGNFNLYGVSTNDSLSNSDIPILIIHGLNDSFVPCEMSKSAFEAAKCEKEILLVDGADHGMSFLVDTTGVTQAIERFFAAH